MSNTNDPLGNKLEIMLEPGNLYLTDYAISRLPSDAPMLEIGSFCDLSTNILTHYEHKHRRNNPLFSCDKWEFENRSGSSIGDSSVSFDRYKQFVRDWFLRNIRTFSEHDLPFTIELFSREFFDMWKREQAARDVFDRDVPLGGPLGFCYVDGNHTHEGAKRDFENCDASTLPAGRRIHSIRRLNRQRLWSHAGSACNLPL